MSEPRLIATHVPKDPEAVVLVLHGGSNRPKRSAVSFAHVARMGPIARRASRADRQRLAVYRLVNSTRGWDAWQSPVDDLEWALGEVASLGHDLQVGLIGHSLGGRAALLSAQKPAVRSVVALNPWVYPQERFGDVDGADVLFVHGTSDRIADPRSSAELSASMARSTRVGRIEVKGGGHGMLRRHRVFSGLAADFTADVLLNRESAGVLASLGSDPGVHVTV